jgi:hypothetical protein
MVKQLRVVSLWLVMFFLAACVGTPTPTTPQPNLDDKMAPTLTASLPAHTADNVPVNVKLAFSFSEAMDKGTLELSGTPPLTLGNPTWNEGSTSVAFDNATLSVSTPYTLTLKAKDVAGNPLAETTISFTTSDTTDTTAPSTPTGLVATPANGQVTLTWAANSDSDIAGYTVYVGTSETALAPRDFVTTNSKTISGLNNGTTYFFAVDAVDGAANKSSKTAPVSATPSATVTDTTPPTLQSSNPANGATDVDPNTSTIQLVFSEPMDSASFGVTVQVDPCLGPVTGCSESVLDATWSESDTVATLTLELGENTGYTLTLTAKDKTGNNLAGDKEVAFMTATLPPRLLSSTPANGATDVPATATDLTFTFSEALNPTYFILGIHPPFACEASAFSVDGTTYTMSGCDLKGSRTYTLSFANITQSGKSLSADVSFSTVADGTPPRVLQTSPASGSLNVPLTTLLSITFDNTMDEASTLAAVSSSAPLGCTWEFNEEKDTLTCSPSNLANNTSYTVTVSTSAKDISGNNLALPPGTLCEIGLPCGYRFTFSTPSVPTTGSLRVNISGLPTNQNRVRVTGPNGYNSGLFDSSQTFSDLPPGDYTVTAQGFGTGQANKPTCRIYFPTPATQIVTVTANATATRTVTYEVESCAPLPDDF